MSVFLLNEAPLRHVGQGRTWLTAGEWGPVWRVESGVVVLQRPAHEGAAQPVQLALAGDLIGAESLCAKPYAFGATALMATMVSPVVMMGDNTLSAIVSQAFLQQQRQTLDMMRLRTGPIQVRLAHLLTLLSQDAAGAARAPRALSRDDLPTLREMALIVDSAVETVCRELNVLLPRASKKAAARKPSWVPPTATGLAFGA